MNNNDKRLRSALSEAEIPEELEPENIEKMLEEKAPKRKRNNIRIAGRIAAGAAACAVICGGAAYYAGQKNLSNIKRSADTDLSYESSNAIAEVSSGETPSIAQLGDAPYMDGAESYEQIYRLFEESAKSYKNSNDHYFSNGAVPGDGYTEEIADENESIGYDSAVNGVGGDKFSETETVDNDRSDTYNQEEGVLEADKAKTDGKYIYYLSNSYYYKSNAVINIAEAEDGQFVSSATLSVDSGFDSENDEYYMYIEDMYLYNDMLAVIGSFNYYSGYNEDTYMWENYGEKTFVSFYTTGSDPQLIDVYYQDGWYNDVRISPDGYLYVLTTYNSREFSAIEDADDIEKYIPSTGMYDSVSPMSASCILLPGGGFGDYYSLTYTVVGSVDLKHSGDPIPVDSKALAGYAGDVYCSADNLYVTIGWDDTSITRIAISGGSITPAANGTVKGYVNDQFSMSEYNGYFRIATTADEYEETFHPYTDEDRYWLDDYEDEIGGYYSYSLTKRDNRVYVLDLDLNIVGSVSDFGLDETIQSVNFSGDLAYVVTFEQTDPLFAIDLSDPANPTILSELHMNGFSSYMQKWGDGLLFGFGIDADDEGVQTGIKLAMFDNSDPNDLREAGVYTVNYDSSTQWIYSPATWDRKALLIAPEKNLIGVPVFRYGNSWNTESVIMLFSYSDGEFTLIGEIDFADDEYYSNNMSDRVLYIGDYVYALSGSKFVAADMQTAEVTDTVEFENSSGGYMLYD